MKDKINLDLGYDDEESDSDVEAKKNQILVVRNMIHIIAKYSASDGFRRHVQLSTGIYRSNSAKGEKPEIHARRFYSLAKTYKTMSGNAEGGSEGEHFSTFYGNIPMYRRRRSKT